MIKLFQYVFLFICILGVYCDDPEVEIPQGTLIGGTRTNIDGGTYYSFLNIPFAEPPINDLRFKAPVAAGSWDGARNATEDLAACLSVTGTGQEDCLYLNVYTPELPSENSTLKAVMVFIYGGAFTSGSAQEDSFGAEFLLTKDVLLVVPNYRVGIFGFLSLDDADIGATGNAGLKDQALALQWVQENIEYFGGDPDNVMVFGESAGSMSVHLHILSPMSEGLFHKALSESGCALTDMVTPAFRNNAVVLAEYLDIQTDDWATMFESLQNISADSLTTAQSNLSDTYEYFTRPIVEIANNNSFLPAYPLDIIKSGNYNQVPYVIGFNSAEGLLFQLMEIEATGEPLVITDFTEYIPVDFNLTPESDDVKNLSASLKEFYFGDTQPSTTNITGTVNLTTDFHLGFPAYRSVLQHLKTAVNPIYFYFFTAETSLNYAKQTYNITAEYPGAAHGDELGYLFYMPKTPVIEEGSVEDLAIRNMVALWTNFAIYSNPTPGGFNYTWEPVQEDEFYYLYIDTEETSLQVNPKPQSFPYWAGLYQEYVPDDLE